MGVGMKRPPQTILVVDGGPIDTLRALAESQWPGVVVQLATCLADARAMLIKNAPDLVVAATELLDGLPSNLLDARHRGGGVPYPVVLLYPPGQIPAAQRLDGVFDCLPRCDGWEQHLMLRTEQVLGVWDTLVTRNRMLSIVQAQVRLSNFAHANSLDSLLQKTLDEAEALTGSNIGFFHFLEPDQTTLSLQMWSTNTLRHMCTAEGKGQHYPVQQAGVWVDCVRERRPVIHNDYASLPHRRGLPEGHAPIVRELVVPIERGGLITCLIGVGNKATDYDQSDVEALQMLANLVWDVVASNRIREQLVESQQRFAEVMESIPTLAMQVYLPDGTIIYWNKACEHIYGYSPAEAIGANLIELIIPPPMRDEVREAVRRMAEEGVTPPASEMTLMRKDGSPTHVFSSHSVVRPPHATPQLYCIDMDLNQIKRDEAELRKSRSELKAIYDLAPVMMCVVDRERNVIYANRALGAYVGVDPAELVRGRACGILKCVHAQEDARGCGFGSECEHCSLTLAMEMTFRTGESAKNIEYRTRLQLPPGPRDVVLLGSTALIDSGEEQRLLLCLEDVTERIHATEALQSSEEKFRAIANYTVDWEMWLGPDRDLLWVNPAVEQLTGYTPAECHAMPDYPLPIIHPDDRPRCVALMHDPVAGHRSGSTEFRIRMKSGEIRWGSISWRTICDGAGVRLGWRASVRDATQRKKVEAALLESEERYRAIIEHSPSAVVLLRNEQCIFANRTACQLLGAASAEELIGEQFSVFLPEHDHDEFLQRQQRCLQSSEPNTPWVHRLRRLDGTLFDVESVSAPIRLPDGPAVLVMGNDLSERRRAEQERLELERRLLQAQKMESLGVLAGGIAHDFNNLLQAIQGNLELVLAGASLDGKTEGGIQEAIRASHRAADLTRQMLAYAGKGQFVLRPFDLGRMFDDCSTMFRAAISKHIELQVVRPPRLPLITADPGQIQQVVMNLLTNAAEAIGDAAGRITLTLGADTIEADTLARCCIGESAPVGRYVWVEIKDNGCGMNEQVQHDLFNPFFTTKFMGRGLGMSAVQGIVKAHHGALLLQSAPNQGTRILVLFPEALQSGAPEETHHSQAATVPVARRVREQPRPRMTGVIPPTPADGVGGDPALILVVDDEEIVRNLCGAILRRLGYTPQLTGDGESAVDFYRRNPERIACVLLDMTMPRMDGPATLRALRRFDPSVRIILCSGYTREESLRRLNGMPIDGFLQKPYRIESLERALSEVLGAGQTPQSLAP